MKIEMKIINGIPKKRSYSHVPWDIQIKVNNKLLYAILPLFHGNEENAKFFITQIVKGKIDHLKIDYSESSAVRSNRTMSDE